MGLRSGISGGASYTVPEGFWWLGQGGTVWVAGHSPSRTSGDRSAAAGDLGRVASLDHKSRQLMERATSQLGLSARAYMRIWRMARTIADVEGVTAVREQHFAEAIQARSLDQSLQLLALRQVDA